MDAAYVLLAVVIALIGVAAKALADIRSELKESVKSQGKLGNRMTYCETMLTIFLHHAGFDTDKVKKAIKEHADELQENGGLGVGCIKIEELYRDKES
jgi:hypothetical protein